MGWPIPPHSRPHLGVSPGQVHPSLEGASFLKGCPDRNFEPLKGFWFLKFSPGPGRAARSLRGGEMCPLHPAPSAEDQAKGHRRVAGVSPRAEGRAREAGAGPARSRLRSAGARGSKATAWGRPADPSAPPPRPPRGGRSGCRGSQEVLAAAGGTCGTCVPGGFQTGSAEAKQPGDRNEVGKVQRLQSRRRLRARASPARPSPPHTPDIPPRPLSPEDETRKGHRGGRGRFVGCHHSEARAQAMSAQVPAGPPLNVSRTALPAELQEAPRACASSAKCSARLQAPLAASPTTGGSRERPPGGEAQEAFRGHPYQLLRSPNSLRKPP